MLVKNIHRFALAAVVALGVSSSASAGIVSVDADAFAAGTVLNNAYSGVTLSASGPGVNDSNVYARTSGLATTGSNVFGYNGAFDPLWGGVNLEIFRADFASATSMVWLDFMASDSSDSGILSWFDASDVLLGSLATGTLNNTSITLMASEATATIAYITATGTGGNDLALDNLQYKVPEPGTLALFGLGLAGLGLARRRKVA